jgi:hypothetical protein
MAVGWHMDSKHDTLVHVLQRLEAALVAVENDGFTPFPDDLDCPEYEYKIELNNSVPSKSSMTIRKKDSNGLVYNFYCGNLLENSIYYSDGGAFRAMGANLPTSTLCTSTNPDAALQVIDSFHGLLINSTGPVSTYQCIIYENGYGAFSNLVLHWSYEFLSFTNEVSDRSSNIICRAC